MTNSERAARWIDQEIGRLVNVDYRQEKVRALTALLDTVEAEARAGQGLLLERVRATAEVGCVNSPAGRRWPMKCLLNDRCSFCRARDLLERLESP
jgi:hypothetical protein